MRTLTLPAAALLFAAGALPAQDAATQAAAEAWVYAYPMLFNYKAMYGQTQDATQPDYVGGFNRFRHFARTFTPKDTTVVTPNNDTPYSWAWLDLRAEPVVLTAPEVPADRYFVVQCVDLFTYNFAYVGSRATGNKGGRYLFAGPGWTGAVPNGIDQVFRPETQFVLLLMRVQLKSPMDMPGVEAVQAGVRLDPLSVVAGTTPPPPAAKVDWPKWDEAKALSFEFAGYLNFLLQFAKSDPSEKDLFARFATVGIGPGQPFDAGRLPPVRRAALEAGAALGKARLAEYGKTVTSSLGLFGTRAELKNDYLKRAAAAALGLYGNSAEEAVYLGAEQDATKAPLDGSKHRYVLRFAPGKLPPAKFFWSATAYHLPSRLLAENPIERYSVGSATPGVKPAADGSLTIHLQADPPPMDLRPNWLPVPRGPFTVVVRLYGPSPEAQQGQWTLPPVERVQ